ncbi:MAG: T9SS type A sorting domain-containing protein, partial [Bacteroidetes bacterium]|nr:T9SS type A sorting domain-containing protein [Bacteroidota bacterium]
DNDGAIPDDGIPLEGPFFAAAGNTFFEFTNPTTSSLRVNQSLLSTGGVTGGSIPYVNVLFTQAFKSGTADGVNHILLNAVQMRDPDNTPITVNLDPDPTPQATLIVDGTPPSIAVAIDNQTNPWTDAWLKDGDQIAVTATITDAYPLTAADITVNLGGLFGGVDHTADHPAGYAAPLASWPVVASASCSPANGAITVTVTAIDALGNVGTGSATITADNTPPNSLANFKANTGHNKVNLTWDDPSGGDPTYRGVLVRCAKWAGYPDYVDPAPAFPASQTDGVEAAVVTGAVFAASHTFDPVERGIFYYRGFVFDQAGNYSVANGSGNDADRSTNYILGDLGSGPGNIGDTPYDGSVDFDDLSLFSYLYFEPDANAPGWPYPEAKEADFGPTSNNKTHGIGSSFGIPDNDGAVEFEDLMIFSMNYNYTATPKIAVPPGSARANAFALSMVPQASNASEYIVTLRIDNDGRPVKGISAELRFDPKVLQVNGVVRGDLLGAEGQSFHGHRTGEGMLRVDCALLGKGLAVEHSGNVATVHFRVLGQGDAALRLASATVRNAANGEVAVDVTETVAELPTTFDLAQNYPNPFNPTTTIKYQVPSPVNVEVTVFNILGEKIATLVNEVQAAGYYTLEWNGRDSRNLALPSGLYFYTMRAGDFSSVKKMMLMK